jgi:hypothetical protein
MPVKVNYSTQLGTKEAPLIRLTYLFWRICNTSRRSNPVERMKLVSIGCRARKWCNSSPLEETKPSEQGLQDQKSSKSSIMGRDPEPELQNYKNLCWVSSNYDSWIYHCSCSWSPPFPLSLSLVLGLPLLLNTNSISWPPLNNSSL